MPRIPKEFLGRKSANFTEDVKLKAKVVKKEFLIYSFVSIILIEIASLFASNLESYAFFIFPILSQLVMFILTITLAMYSDRLRFCNRKKVSMWVLSTYFLFNISAVVFGIENIVYTAIIDATLFATVGYLLITSIKK